MNATEKFFAFLSVPGKPLLRLTDEEFAAFDADAKKRLLSDYNVGQTWSHEDVHYLIPNSGATHEEFHALRAAWQQESSTEG